jgi:hypothetical protein
LSQTDFAETEITSIPRITLRLRAGSANYDTVPDLARLDSLRVLTAELRALPVEPNSLLAMRVRDRGMEPMLFEDDWVVINTSDTVLRSGEVFAVNWNGEGCIQQLVKRGGQWYLNFVNPEFNPINVRSGQLSIVGRVVFQPGRAIAGRL